MANDPIHQFHISQLVPIEIGGLDFSFTNSSLFMVATAAVAGGFLYMTTANRGLIPSRMQSVSEMSYEFVAGMLRDPFRRDEGVRMGVVFRHRGILRGSGRVAVGITRSDRGRGVCRAAALSCLALPDSYGPGTRPGCST